MTAHSFGGKWTEDKLEALKSYLGFYVKAMSNQRFRRVYIDTFAGTGRCSIRSGSGLREIDGSATIALNLEGGFDEYHFIEFKRRHQVELERLKASHAAGQRARIHKGNAAELLWPLLQSFQWKDTRGVLFLDPYGLQCSWDMVCQVADTKALDVFFLVSLSGLYRQAAVDRSAVDETKAAALTRFLGTDEWLTAVYTQQQGDLFGDPLVTRAKGFAGMLQFTTGRLKTAFPYVGDPALLGQVNGAPLYALYFAVSNPSKAAMDLARRVSEHVLQPLR